jgi:uncharacterized membrane protein YjfL (UPF0719 family)
VERANLPPVHATGSRQNTAKQGRCCARSTARSLAAPLVVVVVVVSCFAAAFTTNQTKPKKQQVLNNNTATALFVFIGSLCLGYSARLRSTSNDDQLINE